jgi:hypothetical protein
MPDENTADQPNEVSPNAQAGVSAPPPKKLRYTLGPRFLVCYGGPVKIELSPEALNVFNQIMNMTEDDPADIVRKAISLYKVAMEAHQEGKAVGAASTPAALDTEFVGF